MAKILIETFCQYYRGSFRISEFFTPRWIKLVCRILPGGINWCRSPHCPHLWRKLFLSKCYPEGSIKRGRCHLKSSNEFWGFIFPWERRCYACSNRMKMKVQIIATFLIFKLIINNCLNYTIIYCYKKDQNFFFGLAKFCKI